MDGRLGWLTVGNLNCVLYLVLLISYNLNGIRSATRKGLVPWLQEQAPDVLCLQEVRGPAGGCDWTALRALGYEHIHEHLAHKPGYSGVATLSRRPARHVSVGTGHAEYDAEGRVVRTDFDDLTVLNVYVPSGSRGDRQAFKMRWLAHFADYIGTVAREVPALVVCGDFNICHQLTDIHDPVSNKNSSGFLPEEREWLSQLLEAGYLDSFRHLNPKARDHYSWWSNRPGVRDRNKGWRIDYALISNPLRDRLRRAAVLMEARHSDHCPVLLELQPRAGGSVLAEAAGCTI